MDDNWDCRLILTAAFGRAPDVSLGPVVGGGGLGCWRQVRGPVDLPALPRIAIVAGLPAAAGAPVGGEAPARVPQVMGAGQADGTWRVEACCDLVVLTAAEAGACETRVREALFDALGAALLRQILDEVGAVAPDARGLGDRELYVKTLLRALAAHLSRGETQSGEARLPVSASSAYRLHQVLDALRRSPGDAHTVEQMAASAGLTPDHFSKVFKAAMGVPPRQYLLKLRVERAIRLMGDPKLSLAEISETLGFASQSHFTRVFRTQTGETPSGYRQLASQALH